MCFLEAKTQIIVSYSYTWFNELHNKIKADFERENPDIEVKFTAPTQHYEEQTAKLLREKIVNKLPDVAFDSFNYLPTLQSKNIPQPLDSYLTDKEERGYTDKMLKPTTLNGKVYAIPFAASMPVAYYNMDLVKKAGWNKPLPKTWDEVFELANMINKLPGKQGAYFANLTHVWLQMALVMSQGGEFINKKGKIGFDNEIGEWVFKLLSDFHTKAKMPNIKVPDALKSFYAGNLGMYFESSAGLTMMEKSVGKNFELKVSKWPSVKSGGQLPVGGSVVMLTSTKNAEAAMKYIKYVTSTANKYVPQYTGYMTTNAKSLQELKSFYDKNPNYTVAPSQIEIMGIWPTFPGDNALKCAELVYTYSEQLLTGERTDYKNVLKEMTRDVNKLLP
ncbi:extracellular solute-binding protein [Helicobacter jaachi]|uniref:Extracellular solute-binding protein n=2 Tax=Helicobacter jaachi TaxID=1677920 RepID=A0A4U8TCY0_9HELI|nr:extracellular solute-binding protein [Helicobacter jaachi]